MNIPNLTKDEGGVSLYYQIKQFLRERIKNGEITPGARLPSIAELTRQYGVSKITVTKALSELVQEGLLYGKQGKGIFVKSSCPSLSGKEVVGILMPTTGHFYETFSGTMVRKLMQHDFFPLPVDIMLDRKKGFPRTRTLIEKQPAFLVIDSSVMAFPFEMFNRYNGHIVFIHRFEETEKLPLASYVLSDLSAGGRDVAEYLIKGGYRKIVHYTYIPKHGNNKSFEMVENGIRHAMKKHGIPEDNLRHWLEESEGMLEERIKKETFPLAVVADSDFRLKSLYAIAEKMNLGIPEDIALVGWYNTPWSEIFRPKTTTVALGEEVIAERVTEVITNSAMRGRTVFVKPELIVRESAGKREYQGVPLKV